MIHIIQIIATVHTKKKRLGYDSILLTIKRITQISQRVITASTYQLELCFSLFFQYLTENHNSSLKFSETECSVNCESPVLLLPFENWGMRRTTETAEFVLSRMMSPESSLRFPADQKAWRLWVPDWS